MNRGVSLLGLNHPRMDFVRAMQCFRGAPVINTGWLDNFFGASNRNAERLMLLPRHKRIRVHIMNGPGLNNRRVQPHEITAGETTESVTRKIERGNPQFLAKFAARCKVIAEIFARADSGLTEFYVSPWLERGATTRKAFNVLADIVAREIPQAAIVDNPVRGGFFPGFLREFHGIKAPKDVDIADLDGIDAAEVDLGAFQERHATAKMCLWWSTRCNGLVGGTPWRPPEKRTEFLRPIDVRVAATFVKFNL